jgi:hypothetical protein
MGSKLDSILLNPVSTSVAYVGDCIYSGVSNDINDSGFLTIEKVDNPNN